ncbi:MAG: AAA family ATPase [Acidimicrobiia bacterium]|nr:AAA family ATPase [Acidimicrobiia bacterium]
MPPVWDLPHRLHVQSSDDPWDVIPSLAAAPFLSGELPAARMVTLPDALSARAVAPEGVVEREVVSDRWGERLLVRSGKAVAMVEHRPTEGATVWIVAADAGAADNLADTVRARAGAGEEEPEAVPVEFWYATPRGPRSVSRSIDAPAWEEIEPNYGAAVHAQLAGLVGSARPSGQGRLVLWHGEPGTGKTTAIRALARSWRAWCRTLFVVDPEAFFGQADYLLDVLLDRAPGVDRTVDRATQWRLVVIEDVDELLRADARQLSGQALGRLLNLTDGMIGQGLNVLLLLTTNEPVTRLHPAVVRPGRCLAEVAFSPLSVAEAHAWLGGGGPRPGRPLTLAELYALRSGPSGPSGAVDVRARGDGPYL